MVGGAGTPPALAGLAPFGRFVVEARLGVGGMGEVFRARDGGKPVALKLMRPEIAADPRHRLMFVAEAQLARRLQHRNLVKLHDFGKSHGILWMALELVDGLALNRLLEAGPLAPEVAAHVALELLDALAYVHGRGLIHRDVSAGNTLVSSAGEVKLSDFGVAKIDTMSLTLTNEEKGKPAYMAPEQLREHAPAGLIDGRVDLFAAGVLLHRMVMGTAPFSDVAQWLRDGAPLAPAGPLAPVIARAMHPDRRARFADAPAMAAAIQRAQAPASNAAEALAARVRQCAAAAAPMEDFDRLIIAALGGGARAGGTRTAGPALPSFADEEGEDAVTRQASLSRQRLAAASDAFAEQMPTEKRAAFAAFDDSDDEDDIVTDGQNESMFDYVPTRARDLAAAAPSDSLADSISEAICTSPVIVAALLPPPPATAPEPDAAPESPIPIVTASVLLPAPPTRWSLWLLCGVAALAIVGLLLTLAHLRRAPSPIAAASAPAAPAMARHTPPLEPPPPHPADPHRRGKRR